MAFNSSLWKVFEYKDLKFCLSIPSALFVFAFLSYKASLIIFYSFLNTVLDLIHPGLL